MTDLLSVIYVCAAKDCAMKRTLLAKSRREERKLLCMRCRRPTRHKLDDPGTPREKQIFDLMTQFWNDHSSKVWAKLKVLCPCPLCEQARVLTSGQTNDMIREAAKLNDEEMDAQFKAVGMKPLRRKRSGVF